MAASEPRAPMAMPTSARDSTGASLMPSPTKASFSLPLGGKQRSTGPPCRRAAAGVVLVQAQLPPPRGHRLGVAGEHDGLAYAGGLQGADGLGAVGLHHVGNHDEPAYCPSTARGRWCPRSRAGAKTQLPSAGRCRRQRACRPPWRSRRGRPSPPRPSRGGGRSPCRRRLLLG